MTAIDFSIRFSTRRCIIGLEFIQDDHCGVARHGIVIHLIMLTVAISLLTPGTSPLPLAIIDAEFVDSTCEGCGGVGVMPHVTNICGKCGGVGGTGK